MLARLHVDALDIKKGHLRWFVQALHAPNTHTELHDRLKDKLSHIDLAFQLNASIPVSAHHKVLYTAAKTRLCLSPLQLAPEFVAQSSNQCDGAWAAEPSISEPCS